MYLVKREARAADKQVARNLLVRALGRAFGRVRTKSTKKVAPEVGPPATSRHGLVLVLGGKVCESAKTAGNGDGLRRAFVRGR